MLNSIYANNSSVVPIYNSEQQNREANMKMLVEQQAKKKTKAYKNPIRLDRNTIKLEKDAIMKDKYYLTFTYSSEKVITANFYFNAEMEMEGNPKKGNK